MTPGGQGRTSAGVPVALAAGASAATLWGLSGIVVKDGLGSALSAEALLVLRLVGSAILIGGGVVAWRPDLIRLPRVAWAATLVLGAAQAVLQYAYYRAVTATNVGTAVFLEYLAPILVVVVSWGRGRLRFERWSISATLVALAGSWLLVTGGVGALQLSSVALRFGLLAAAMLAAQNLLLEGLLPKADRTSILLWSTVAAALASLPLGDAGALLRLDVLAGRPGLSVGYMVVLATVVPMLLLMVAIRRLGAAKAGLVVTLEPVVASVAAAGLLGERMSAPQWGGGGLILAALVLMQSAPSASPDE
jgi:drug/metabolite transporter (DMT)-like permease